MDAKLDGCWNQSLDYFTEALIKSLNDYSSSLLHIERWKIRHPEEAGKYDKFEENSLTQVLSSYSEDKKLSQNGPLNATVLEQIIMDIMNKTEQLKEKYHSESVLLPSYSCPIPCDYYPKIWIALCFVMFTICILTVISVISYYCVHSSRRFPDGFKRIYSFTR